MRDPDANHADHVKPLVSGPATPLPPPPKDSASVAIEWNIRNDLGGFDKAVQDARNIADAYGELGKIPVSGTITILFKEQ